MKKRYLVFGILFLVILFVLISSLNIINAGEQRCKCETYGPVCWDIGGGRMKCEVKCIETECCDLDYGSWSSCSAPCGGGTQCRSNECGDRDCRSCNTHPCCTVTDWINSEAYRCSDIDPDMRQVFQTRTASPSGCDITEQWKDLPCETGLICYGEGECLAPFGGSCINDTDCMPDLVCVDGECIVPFFNNDLDSGLRSMWTMDASDGSGADVAVDVFRSYNGSVSGAIFQVGMGVNEDAYEFDGLNDFIDIGDRLDFPNRQDFSISAWFNMNSSPTGGPYTGCHPIVQKGEMDHAQPGAGYGLHIAKPTNTRWRVCDESIDTCIGRNASYALSTGVWYHIIGTYGGGTSSSSLKIYINGIKVDNADYNYGDGPFDSLEDISKNLFIGRGEFSTGNSYFDGLIDEVAIWNRELNDTEIVQLLDFYKMPIGGSCIDDTDCQSGLVCVNGSCLVPFGGGCNQNSDCVEDLVCINGICQSQSSGGESCDEDADCAGNLSCINGTCGNAIFGGCFGDEDCQNGLVCDRGAVTVNLNSFDNPQKNVSINGEFYAIELLTATDLSATIRVEDVLGDFESAEIDESESKIVQGINVMLVSADENASSYNATIVVSALEGICLTPPGGGCILNAECAEGLVCINGICTTQSSGGGICDEPDDCEEGLDCINGICGNSLFGLCNDDNDCIGDLICDNGTCLVPFGGECNLNEDCENDLVCLNNICVNASQEGGSCEMNDDCAGDLVCINGTCVTPYISNQSDDNQSYVLSPVDQVVIIDMFVDFYNGTDWIDDGIVLEDYSVQLYAGVRFRLDTLWNNMTLSNGYNTGDALYGPGLYRARVDIYDELMNPITTAIDGFNLLPIASDITLDGDVNITVTNQTETNVSVNFSSLVYPINVTFNLYDIGDNLVDTQGPTTLDSQDELPIDYQVPGGLPLGDYDLYMTLTDSNGTSQTFFVGTITVIYGCVDSDGRDYYQIGVTNNVEDVCMYQDGTHLFITEGYCIGDLPEYEVYACPYGCEINDSGYALGRCAGQDGVVLSCIDSDDGINSTSFGTVTADGIFRNDTCFGANGLIEWYCDNDVFNFTTINCLYGCVNGSCLAEAPQIPVSDCQELNTSNVAYVLSQDISYDDTCFNITGDNVTLDGNGFVLSDDNTTSSCGVYVGGYENVIIRNLSITNFESGVCFVDTFSSVLQDISVYNNQYGLHLAGNSNLNVFVNLQAYDNYLYNILDTSSSNNSIVFENEWGQIAFTSGPIIDNLTMLGDITFPGNLNIGNNSAYLNDAELPELANSNSFITLRQLSTPLWTNLAMHRDGIECDQGTSPSCVNLTALNLPNVIFFVSGWSTYSIYGELPPFCGDGTCDSGESCSNCPSDCGNCPPTSSPGGGGGTTSERGGDCINFWVCDEWTGCINGLQTRTCEPAFKTCLQNLLPRPSERKICIEGNPSFSIVSESLVADEGLEEPEEVAPRRGLWVYVFWPILIILLVLLIIYLIAKEREHAKKEEMKKPKEKIKEKKPAFIEKKEKKKKQEKPKKKPGKGFLWFGKGKPKVKEKKLEELEKPEKIEKLKKKPEKIEKLKKLEKKEKKAEKIELGRGRTAWESKAWKGEEWKSLGIPPLAKAKSKKKIAKKTAKKKKK